MSPASFVPSIRCVVVTGPRGAGKTRFTQACMRAVFARRPEARVAMLLAEEGRTRMTEFGREHPGVVVQKLFLPCLCCAANGELSRHAQALAAPLGDGWLFLELPIVAAPALLAEFDRELGWPREVIACLTPAWAAAWHANALSPFQITVLAEANVTITSADEAAAAVERTASKVERSAVPDPNNSVSFPPNPA